MEPINISFQTTNPELRCKMLNNRFAGDCLKYADAFYEQNGYSPDGVVLEISTEKLTNDIEAPETGTLHIIAHEGETITCGEPIAEIK